MLKPISIGPVQIASPVILAPMTGVTDLPFRRIVKRYGAGLTVSEMIASQAMIRETRQSLQKALWDPAEEPVSLQLAGCEPEVMAEAAKLNEQRPEKAGGKPHSLCFLCNCRARRPSWTRLPPNRS